MSEGPETECAILLSNLIEYWMKCAAEFFSKNAAGLLGAESQYKKSLKEYKTTIFVPKWMDQYQASVLANQMGRASFGCFGELLHIVLFTEWSHSAIDDGRPAVSFPEKNLVGKYAKNVVYYVAGWTLYSASKALTIAAAKREMYAAFARAHSLEPTEAINNANLPTSQVERRKKRGKVYCSEAYYKFICFLESVYLTNLNLKMMQAYTDGDIVVIIKKSLLTNDKVCEEFTKLCDNEHCACYGEEDVHNIMNYVMTRYANMRGTFFAKHLKTNGSGNLVAKMANNQSTRARVVNAVTSSKAVGDATEDDKTKEL